MSETRENLLEIKRDGIDFTDGLNVDDIQKLKELDNRNINVFELNEEKQFTQVYVSTKLSVCEVNVPKDENQNGDKKEDSNGENSRDNIEI